MNLVLDCHCHSVASGHAYSTIDELAISAEEKGLELIAITDHTAGMPGGAHMFHFMNLKVLPEKLHGVEIMRGVEANIIDPEGQIDATEEVLEEVSFVIASMHPPTFPYGEKKDVMKALMNVMRNPRVNVIGHPDDGRFPIDYSVLVQEAKETKTLLEVNNSSLKPTSFRAGAEENYKKMLEYCKEYKVPIILGSDSHFMTEVGNFQFAEAVLKKINFPEELIANTSVNKLKELMSSKA